MAHEPRPNRDKCKHEYTPVVRANTEASFIAKSTVSYTSRHGFIYLAFQKSDLALAHTHLGNNYLTPDFNSLEIGAVEQA